MWRSPGSLLFAVLVACACTGGGVRNPELEIPTASAPPTPSPCEVAAVQRARVPGLLAEGKLDRTVRVIARADALCPKSAPETWGALVTALADLGKVADARRVADAIDAAAGSSEAARTAAREARAAGEPGDVAALLAAGRAAKQAGDSAGAQRLFDRALAAVESDGVTRVAAAPPLEAADGPIALGSGGQKVAIASGDAVSIRDQREGLRETARLEGHEGDVTGLAFSPDGALVATGGKDGTVRLWSAATGAEQRRLEGHTAEVNDVAFSPDGRALASASADETVRLWSVATGAQTRKLEPRSGAVAVVAFSPDGQSLASGSSEEVVHLWSVATGPATPKLIMRQGGGTGVASLAFSPDGKTLVASPGMSRLTRRSVTTGASKGDHFLVPAHADRGQLVIAAISSDGQTAITGGCGSGAGCAAVWAVATGKKVRDLRGEELDFYRAAFSRDGKTMATRSGHGTVRLWSAATGDAIARIVAGASAVEGIALSLDHNTLAASTDDGTIRLWSIVKGAELRALRGHLGPSRSIAFSADATALATSESWQDGKEGDPDRGYGVRVWSLARGVEVSKLGGLGSYAEQVAFSPDGKVVLVAQSYALTLWDLVTGTTTSRLPRVQAAGYRFAFSPDRTTIAFDAWWKSLQIWDIAGETRSREMLGHTGAIRSVAFSPSGDIIASGATDNLVRLWSARTGALVHTLAGHTAEVHALAFSPLGVLLASASKDGTVRLWDIGTGAAVRRFEHAHVISLAVSAGVIAWSSGDHAVRLSFFSGGKDRVLVLRALAGRDAGYAVMDGAVELLGAEAGAAGTDLVCRAGTLSFPFDLCRERFEVQGLLAAALRSTPLPLDP
jgi:WD40 repeat protein